MTFPSANSRTNRLSLADTTMSANRQGSETIDSDAAVFRERMSALVDAEDRRHFAIARMLHDSVGQQVAALLLALRQMEQPGEREVRTTSTIVRELAHTVGRDVARVMAEIYPEGLAECGLAVALASYLEEWSEVTKIRAELDAVSVETDRLPRLVEVGLFLIVSAAMREIARHRRATRVSVVLKRRGANALAIVEDDAIRNGRRDEPRSDDDRAIMIGRVALLGGTLTIEPRAGGGVTTFIQVPIDTATRS